MTLAVLMASYNRKATTLAALERLYAQTGAREFVVYLLDDNSPDGTADAVAGRYPRARLLHGDGNLFWCGGMRQAFAAALAADFDFYLWLNDDTLLDADAVERLLSAYRSVSAREGEAAIVVGSTRDARSGRVTYGGLERVGRMHPFHYRLVQPGAEPRPCLTMNGNCVLIPRAVAARVGNLSREFRHSIGDIDYGLRARKAGCTLWVAPGSIGTCSHNAMQGSFADRSQPLRLRWHHLMSPKGLPPREHFVFARRHGGWLWWLFWMMPYARVVLSSLLPHRQNAAAKERKETTEHA